MKSVKLGAGDVVNFKRVSSFSGSPEINGCGSESKPMLLTACGEGELRKFTNPTTRDSSANALILNGDHIIVDNLHFDDTPGEHVFGMLIMTKLAALRIAHGADHCI